MQEIEIIKILTMGLAIALALGYITNKLRLSPIIGYLLAGFFIGPNFPGVTADYNITSQLANVGIIILMFGVGLHFDLKDIMAVKNIAVPGAIMQSLITATIGTYVAHLFVMPINTALVIGVGLSVASTVVLMKLLEENKIFGTTQGHTAVGWLICEDMITVVALVILPSLAKPEINLIDFSGSLVIAILKVIAFGAITIFVGRKVMPVILTYVARSRSSELFTLTILVTAFSVAAIAADIFGASFALGAFLAGMVVANTKVSHKAIIDILPMKDAFAVLFFISVGMLFDPRFIVNNIGFVAACMAIVLLMKPIVAFVLVLILGYSSRTALTIGIGIAQIGEFSFILAQAAQSMGIMSQDGYSILITCSLLAIALNPVFFKLVPRIESLIKKNEKLWNILNRKDRIKELRLNDKSKNDTKDDGSHVIVIGYGPVGKRVTQLLRNKDFNPLIIDLNIDTIKELSEKGIPAIYGDGDRKELLIDAGIDKARYVFITLPDVNDTITIISEIMQINSNAKIFARARYSSTKQILKKMGNVNVFIEEDAVSSKMVSAIEKSIN